MTTKELKKILDDHQAWLDGKENGKQADLSEANLCGANLSGAKLRGADLSEANLCGANLSGANLYGANLYGANLYGANLYGANLYVADLSEANLCGANLSGAKLREADLSGANLYGADLSGAKNASYIPMACPDTGCFIGWKKASGFIVKLLIPEEARRSSATSRKCRCDKAVVLAIESLNESSLFCKNDSTEDSGVLFDVYGNPVAVRSNYNHNFMYKIGETVSVDNFDTDRFNECSTGIHFFINRQEAVDY